MGFSILTDLPDPAPTPYSKSFGVGSIATQSSKTAKTGATSVRMFRQKAKVGHPPTRQRFLNEALVAQHLSPRSRLKRF